MSLTLGTALNDLNRARSALPHLELAAQLAEQSRDDATRPLVLLELARSQLANGELSKAEAAMNSAFEIAKSSGNQQTLARTTQGLAEYHHELNDYAKAQEYATESLALFTPLQDRRGYAKSLITLGLIASDLYESEKATTLYMQAFATSKVIDYKGGVVDALTFSGHLAGKEGRLQAAIEFYLEAEKSNRSWATILDNRIFPVVWHMSTIRVAMLVGRLSITRHAETSVYQFRICRAEASIYRRLARLTLQSKTTNKLQPYCKKR